MLFNAARLAKCFFTKCDWQTHFCSILLFFFVVVVVVGCSVYLPLLFSERTERRNKTSY